MAIHPMATAAHDRPVMITDRDGVRAEATWNPAGEVERDDGRTTRGRWETEAGWICPDEATGWEMSLERLFGV